MFIEAALDNGLAPCGGADGYIRVYGDRIPLLRTALKGEVSAIYKHAHLYGVKPAFEEHHVIESV